MSSKAKAIAMWDFSWLERRWPGAGYEDWDKVLDELVERGYNAVRIDAWPHLCANDPFAEYWLDPHWDNMVWGSPALNRVQVQPNLNRFIKKCVDRGISVGLSTWWREDRARLAGQIKTPQQLGEIRTKCLDAARLGLGEGHLRVRNHRSGENRPLGMDRCRQFLRPAVCRHVAGCPMASAADDHNKILKD